MSAKLKMSTTCRLPVRLGFGVLGGLLGALNPAWIYLLCSPDHTSFASRIRNFTTLNAFDFATVLIFSILIIPTFLSTFILFPWFYSKLAEMRAKRKIGFWQLWRIGIVFGLAASFLTALFLLGACEVYYNISHQISSLADLWMLLPGSYFLGVMGIFISFPAFLLSSLIFAWATLQYQMTTKP